MLEKLFYVLREPHREPQHTDSASRHGSCSLGRKKCLLFLDWCCWKMILHCWWFSLPTDSGRSLIFVALELVGHRWCFRLGWSSSNKPCSSPSKRELISNTNRQWPDGGTENVNREPCSLVGIAWNTWWLIPLSKWVITPVISGLTLLIPFITGVITHLLSGMSHQVAMNYTPCVWLNSNLFWPQPN